MAEEKIYKCDVCYKRTDDLHKGWTEKWWDWYPEAYFGHKRVSETRKVMLCAVCSYAFTEMVRKDWKEELRGLVELKELKDQFTRLFDIWERIKRDKS